jgi:hypothetical protein
MSAVVLNISTMYTPHLHILRDTCCVRQLPSTPLPPLLLLQIDASRQQELRQLAVRKYLDALCVYFWAATSTIFTLFTFGLVVLLGQPLTAQVVFTSLALFGILIAPLNAFPWVVNGVVEALVSVRRLQAFLVVRDIKAHWSEQQAARSGGGGGSRRATGHSGGGSVVGEEVKGAGAGTGGGGHVGYSPGEVEHAVAAQFMHASFAWKQVSWPGHAPAWCGACTSCQVLSQRCIPGVPATAACTKGSPVARA